MLPPENESEALELIRHMESYYSEALTGFDEDDIFYEGRLDEFIETPEGFDVTIPTTARAVVDEAVDNANPQDIIVLYPPRGVGKKAEAEADNVRRAVRALWAYWRTSGNDIDIVRDFLKNLFKSGKACFKIAPDWSLWPVLTEDTEAELKSKGSEALEERVALIEKVRSENVPIYCRSIAPQCILEDPTVATRKLWIIERYQSSIAEVANTYSTDVEEFRGYDWYQDVPVHEVWTATYVDWKGNLKKGRHMVFVNQELRVDDENPYDDLPYVVKYSGYGREAYEGKPEYKSVGFFTRQNKSMFLAEARRFTHFDAIMSQLAFPIALLPDSVDQNAISFAPGAINFVPDAVLENFGKVWLTAAIPDAEYLNSLTVIGNQIERGTVQRALRGAGVPGTDSAAQYGMISSQAKMRIESCKQATEQAMAMASSRALRYIDQDLQDRVAAFVAEAEVDNHSVGPSDIRGRYRVGIQFQPNEDAIKERKLVLANDAIAKGGLSPYDAYLFAGFENPMELIARRRAYDMMEEPLIKRALAKRALKEWGEDGDALELEEQMAEGEKQMMLKQFMEMLQMGTMRGVGDPMSPNGSPLPVEQPMPMLPEGQPMQGGNIPMPVGAPAIVQQAPVAGAVQDIAAMGSV